MQTKFIDTSCLENTKSPHFFVLKCTVLHNVRVFAQVMFLVTPYKFFNNKYKQEICLLR